MPEYFEEQKNWSEYRKPLDEGRISIAIDKALEQLSDRKKNSPGQYPTDHKGTPFYVLGYAAYASHDYLSASLYFDAAVAADLKYKNGNLDTPAICFIQLLHYTAEPVLAQSIIQTIEKTVEQLLDDYRARNGMQNITLQEIRTRFFHKILTQSHAHQRTLITAFISFVAEWPYRAKQFELIDEGTREPFFLHLFRGCLLFESILKSVPGTVKLKTLGNLLAHFGSQLGLVNPIQTSASTFDDIIVTLTPNMDIACAVTSCARSRNTLGHNLVWATNNFTPQTYDFLVKNIAVSCLHAISKLYP